MTASYLSAGVVHAITLPFAAVATTYLYCDLLVREQLVEKLDTKATTHIATAEI